jgi:hypothetical protein
MGTVSILHGRRRSRHIGNLVAHIDFRDGREPIMVCVWPTSLGGACVLVAADTEIPERFDLVIDGLARPVEKLWRRWSLLGMKTAVNPEAPTV